jgi:hypothetical protein
MRQPGREARPINALPALLLTLCALLAPAVSAQPESPYRYRSSGPVVAIGDVHGDYEALVRTLQRAGVIDASARWSGGDRTLVMIGDLLDRGPRSRDVMDLLMRLEDEAGRSDGQVVMVLGNHELMNLVGDLRYVSDGEYAAFAADESDAEREAWFQRWLARRDDAASADADSLRAAFDRERPPGLYAHRRAFGSSGRYGRWLLGKPVMAVVNDSAFVHAGLSPDLAGTTLDALNERLREEIRAYVAALDVLYAAGLLDPAVNFYDQPDAVAALLADDGTPASLSDAAQQAARTIRELSRAAVHASDSPLWYRGTVACSAPTELGLIDATLQTLGARRVVVGHTPTATREIQQRFDGRVIEIDTGMLSAYYRGSGSALVIEGDALSVVREATDAEAILRDHPPWVGTPVAGLTDTELETLLQTGAASTVAEHASGADILELKAGERSVRALQLDSSRRPGREQPAIAAYRLDRLLGLDMVPVTVTRELNGRHVVLQYLPDNSRDEAQRQEARQGGGAWCPLPRQWNSMYLFDALIGNSDRSAPTMLYNTADWQLLLLGQQEAFSTSTRLPAYLRDREMRVTPEWHRQLDRLPQADLDPVLSDLVSSRQRRALLERAGDLLD